jgi:hydrogenase nickel incorporation protein HypB
VATISVVKQVLDANDRIAAGNRSVFDELGIYVINLMSSPGAGKTTLVERTIEGLMNTYKIAVIEGDIQDTYDAERVAKLGSP